MAMSFLEGCLDGEMFSRFSDFRDSLPEDRREAFTGFVCRVFLAGEDRIHEMWAEHDAGEDL